MELKDFLFGLLEGAVRDMQASEVSAKYMPGKGAEITVEGKASDVTILSLILARKVIMGSPTTVEEYYEMLKRAVAKDVENEIKDIKEIFIDVCIKTREGKG